MADSLANMFDDLQLESVTAPRAPAAAAAAAPAPATTPARRAELQMMTLRGAASGFELDALIEAEQTKSVAWKPRYAAGEEVEAVWEEDHKWYRCSHALFFSQQPAFC